MPAGGTLSITTKTQQDKYDIEVKDSGPGVSKHDRDRIFNPFVTTRESGTGLGLAIAQRIVHGHGGHIKLVSEPGEGATFVICLPMSVRDSESISHEKQ